MTVFERREGDWALLETEEGLLRIPLSHLSPHAEEGSVLVEVEGFWQVDEEATRIRREAVRARMARFRRTK